VNEYPKSPIRAMAQLLHKAFMGFGKGLELVSDAFVWVVLAVGVCVGSALVLSDWLPLTSSGFDFWLWIALWFAANTAIALWLRALRRRRFGTLPSRHVEGVKAACIYVLAGWLGLLALIALLRDLSDTGPLRAWTAIVAIVAAVTLIPTLVGLYRYVTQRGELSEP